MSRIGKKQLQVPKGIKASVADGVIMLEGAKGKLQTAIPGDIEIKISADMIQVNRHSDTKLARSLHGTVRMLISNMIQGLVTGYKKELDVVGVGYKALMKGNVLVMNMGFSHLVEMVIPQGLKVTVPNPNRVIVEGIDKQLLGQFCSNLRRVYPPEPYQGKGIRYVGEEVRKKLGKALAK
jgi:large subunit ribosomal protein L6